MQYCTIFSQSILVVSLCLLCLAIDLFSFPLLRKIYFIDKMQMLLKTFKLQITCKICVQFLYCPCCHWNLNRKKYRKTKVILRSFLDNDTIAPCVYASRSRRRVTLAWSTCQQPQMNSPSLKASWRSSPSGWTGRNASSTDRRTLYEWPTASTGSRTNTRWVESYAGSLLMVYMMVRAISMSL